MKPVNLIPPEERRGGGAPTRTGRAPYMVLAALGALVAALAMISATNGSIADREAEIASLEIEEQAASARAEALRPFAEFAATRQAREQTISSLARSRFDWERVMSELSRVLPSNVWLTELAASAGPDVPIDGPDVSLRSQVEGPALILVGCGRDHDAVATLIAAMEDIDGVTRVTATNSSKSKENASGPGAGGGSECQTRASIAAFELIVAFDNAAAPVAATEVATP